jgi:hypothetical protein
MVSRELSTKNEAAREARARFGDDYPARFATLDDALAALDGEP